MYRQIEDTKYEVNNEGLVRNVDTGKVLKPQKRGEYLKVTLSEDGVAMQLSVHRLVAKAFCERVSIEKTIVDHIDGNKHNNSSENLRWVTYAENSRNGVRLNDLPDYIYQDYYKTKDGTKKTIYSYRRFLDGKNVRLISSLNLDEVKQFKNQYENGTR